MSTDGACGKLLAGTVILPRATTPAADLTVTMTSPAVLPPATLRLACVVTDFPTVEVHGARGASIVFSGKMSVSAGRFRTIVGLPLLSVNGMHPGGGATG